MTASMTGAARRARRDSSRRELAVTALAGAAGAGLVLLAARQDLARVVTRAPRPLPSASVVLTGQDLRPAVAALAIAALASVVAVIATGGWLRRLTGLVAAALGAGIGALSVGQVTTAEALQAARRASNSGAAGPGAGLAPGSTTAGSGTGSSDVSIGGFPAHVVLTGGLWRWLMVCGALILVGMGIVVMFRARAMPAMSARYTRPDGGAQPHAGRQRGRAAGSAGPAGSAPGSALKPARPAAVQASMWESLSAGLDPTASAQEDDRA